MLRLIIDTATKYFYVCLLNDDEVLAIHQIAGVHGHAEHSIAIISQMLGENGLSAADINEVYCGAGPGSYTGVRIAVTIAKMICSLHDIPLYEVSSLFIAGSGYGARNVAVMFDARRGNVFCACYGDHPIVEKLRSKEDFEYLISNLKGVVKVNENDYSVNHSRVIAAGKLVQNVDAFVPNYLRITEAEYNLEHHHD